jgi:isopentenyldiphosphate isomerase/sugar phosphate isomerase/epimerase
MKMPHNPDEVIAIVDINDRIIGKGRRKEIHENEKIHREVAGYIIKDNRALLQRRKDSNRWDHSCAGHFPFEQSYENAIKRESKEELGVLLNFQEIGHEHLITNYGLVHDRFVKIFVTKTELELGKFLIDPKEVIEIKFFTVAELKELIKNEDITTESLRKITKKYIMPFLCPLVGLSTGAIHSWVIGIDNKLRLFKQLDMDAIEIIFSNSESLDQEISDEMISYVKSLSYVSIHAPFYEKEKNPIIYGKNNNDVLFQKLKYWYDLFGAQSLTIHQNLIKDWEMIDQSGMNVSIENLPSKHNISINDMNNILNTHVPDFIVLDTAHALTYGIEELNNLIKTFKNRIQHIHFSDRRFSPYHNKIRDHEQLLFCNQMDKFDGLLGLNRPIIIEVSVKDKKNDLTNLQKEIDFVRKFFNKIKRK